MTGRHAAVAPWTGARSGGRPPGMPQITEREMPNMADVRARYQTAAMAGEHAHHSGGFDKSTAAAVTRSQQDVSDLHDSLRVVAADVLALAQMGGMPDSWWLTDRRVARACAVLGLAPEDARRLDWTAARG